MKIVRPTLYKKPTTFDRLAFEKIKRRFGEQRQINRRDFYRVSALLFTFNKFETRQLLRVLKPFGVRADSKCVYLGDCND